MDYTRITVMTEGEMAPNDMFIEAGSMEWEPEAELPICDMYLLEKPIGRARNIQRDGSSISMEIPSELVDEDLYDFSVYANDLQLESIDGEPTRVKRAAIRMIYRYSIIAGANPGATINEED